MCCTLIHSLGKSPYRKGLLSGHCCRQMMRKTQLLTSLILIKISINTCENEREEGIKNMIRMHVLCKQLILNNISMENKRVKFQTLKNRKQNRRSRSTQE